MTFDQERTPLVGADLLAQKLAALPSRQLDALEQAINGCMDYAVSLMSWMRDLVHWESARRARRETSTLPLRIVDLDVGTAVLTLSVLTALFQTSAPTATADIQPTIDLLNAIQQWLPAWAAGENTRVH